MTPEQIQAEVKEALDRILDRALRPEVHTDPRRRCDWLKLRAGERLSVRLELLLAVKTWALDLVRAIPTDKESIADAKAHRLAGKEESHAS